MALEANDRASALPLLNAAVERFERCGSRLHLARSLRLRAEPGDAERAAGIFEECGAGAG